jgi:biopolymer transport protein ExbD
MRLRPATAVPNDALMSDLNTTPLIDVMLVLLIMFIITIPMSSHEVPLDLPQGTPPPVTTEPVRHQLQIDAAGRLAIDGSAVSGADLPARLRTIAAEPGSELLLSADGETPYERFDEVLAAVRIAGVTRLGMDNHRFREAMH